MSGDDRVALVALIQRTTRDFFRSGLPPHQCAAILDAIEPAIRADERAKVLEAAVRIVGRDVVFGFVPEKGGNHIIHELRVNLGKETDR